MAIDRQPTFKIIKTTAEFSVNLRSINSIGRFFEGFSLSHDTP